MAKGMMEDGVRNKGRNEEGKVRNMENNEKEVKSKEEKNYEKDQREVEEELKEMKSSATIIQTTKTFLLKSARDEVFFFMYFFLSAVRFAIIIFNKCIMLFSFPAW
jgi:hypothetical protein